MVRWHQRIHRKGDILQDPVGREARGDRRGWFGSTRGVSVSERMEGLRGA